MKSFALYRLPFSDVYSEVIQSSGDPIVLSSIDEIGSHQGFVIAPFSADEKHSIVVLTGDSATHSVPASCKTRHFTEQNTAFCRVKHGVLPSETYAFTFQLFFDQIARGNFRKIVLARQTSIEVSESDKKEDFLGHAKDLFFHACRLYPRMFVALVSTPQTGTWLVATPETLLSGSKGEWRTMALAGTMKLSPTQMDFDTPPTGTRPDANDIRWSDKNIAEQRHVASYIHTCLERFASDIHEDGPYTSRAGNLVHLRSDFSFRLADDTLVGPLLDALHPTPAVCGLPKDDAKRFIIDNEPCPRKYYSGFMGPIGIASPSAEGHDTTASSVLGDTHLYVTLRCMELTPTHYHLYAGGGLMPKSVMEHEWEETEEKMQTMRRVISEE